MILRAARITAATCSLALTFSAEASLPTLRDLCTCIMVDTAIALRGSYQFPVCLDLTAYSRAVFAYIFCNLGDLQPLL